MRENNPANTPPPTASASSPVAPSTGLNVPDFGAHGAIYAVTARLAGRLNAASISDKEQEALLAERQRLLDKELDGTISRRELNRLEYVRWTLDIIEDAKYGVNLDVIEDAISMYERFVVNVNDLKAQLHDLTSRRGKS
jgi:hypothetical protein